MNPRNPSAAGLGSIAVFRALAVTAALIVLCLSAVQVLAQPEPLAHFTVDERINKLQTDPALGFRFVAFGDQKNLWKKNNAGEFGELLAQVRQLSSQSDLPVLFMTDSGDIVNNGRQIDQFEHLRNHLAAVKELPYLVAVGNHELDKINLRARTNTFEFLQQVVDEPDFSDDQLYYEKPIGRARFLFLDTNDFPGIYKTNAARNKRAAAQMDWLDEQLRTEVHPTIAVMHHPFILSAKKHRDHARTLWNNRLPQKLIDGGVDLVVSGHVHTSEVFVLERGGRKMWFLNVSGRPTWPRKWGISWPWPLPYPKNSRRPKRWDNPKEKMRATKPPFRHLDEWDDIRQIYYMSKDEEDDQYAVITVDRHGALQIEIRSVKKGSILSRFSIR